MRDLHGTHSEPIAAKLETSQIRRKPTEVCDMRDTVLHEEDRLQGSKMLLDLLRYVLDEIKGQIKGAACGVFMSRFTHMLEHERLRTAHVRFDMLFSAVPTCLILLS